MTTEELINLYEVSSDQDRHELAHEMYTRLAWAVSKRCDPARYDRHNLVEPRPQTQLL
jgi:tRNA splicing ligase